MRKQLKLIGGIFFHRQLVGQVARKINDAATLARDNKVAENFVDARVSKPSALLCGWKNCVRYNNLVPSSYEQLVAGESLDLEIQITIVITSTTTEATATIDMINRQ